MYFYPLKEKVGKVKKLLWTLDILTVKRIIARSHSHSNSHSSSGRNGSDFFHFFFLSLLFDIVIDDRLSAPAVFLLRCMSLLHFIRSCQGGRIMECLWNLTDRISKSNLYHLRFFFKFDPFTQLVQLFPAINERINNTSWFIGSPWGLNFKITTTTTTKKQSKNGQKTLIDISPKKTCTWPVDT